MRLASIDYAAGKISEAMQRLRRDDRVVEADTPDLLLDALAADWYVDRQQRSANPDATPSSMTADHHVERRELNERARALLAADGTLRGPSVEVAGQSFQVGDEVVAMEQDRELRPNGADRSDFVRNGERGRVVEVAAGRHPLVVVDFARRGRVSIDFEHLTKRVRPGVVGQIAHAYAVTSHMAQGENYQAGRHLSTDASSREGVYVGLTRGRGDARLYLVRRRDLVPAVGDHAGLPRLDEEDSTLTAVTRRLESQRAERLARELDPSALRVDRLRRSHDLAGLAALALAGDDPAASLAGRAYRQAADALASRACLDVDPALAARLGPRPGAGPRRQSWDRAVGAVAVYRARWDAASTRGGPGASWALGPAPASGAALAQYHAAAEALEAAERSGLSGEPTIRLAEERRQLRRTLASGPVPAQHQHAESELFDAQRQLTVFQEERTRAGQRLDELQGAKAKRRNPQVIEMARRSLQRADQRYERAVVEVEQAETTVAALHASAPAQEAVRARLDPVEAALARQVDRAVSAPAPYLIAALGERPLDEGQPSRRWHESATRIETYRHRELGRSPSTGVAVDVESDALLSAIGARPDNYLGALQWDHVVEAVAPDLNRAMEPQGPDLRP